MIRTSLVPERDGGVPQDAAAYLMQTGAVGDVALIQGDARWDYGELACLMSRIGDALLALDLPVGARVGLQGPNSPYWVAGYLAVMRLGMVAVPFPSTFTKAELERGAVWVDARAVLSEHPPSAGFDVPTITPSDLADEPMGDWPTTRRIAPDSDAVLLFTSGSTGRPRAVRITHMNLRANTESIIEFLGLTRSDRMLVILPFAYSFGVSLLNTHLRVGGSLVLVNSMAYPEKALDTLERESCTGLAGVPSSFHLLLRNSTFRSRELPSLRQIQQAGGKLPAVLVEELVTAQPHARVFVMYGQTEATARLSYLRPELAREKAGSIGRGIPGVELVVRDQAGHPVSPGEVGEIFARGPSVSPGYLNDPEATREKFVDGGLRTGDLATIDQDGFIYIVDRTADFIKTWGYRVSSQEVEAAAMRTPDLVAAAAVGVPDSRAGERVELFVVARPGAEVTAMTVMAQCATSLAKHMRPSAVHFLPALPLNSNGKVSKTALRAMVPGDNDRAN